MTWNPIEQEPKLERVYLVFSPKFGYQTLMWENKPLHRAGFWDSVTQWAEFDFAPINDMKRGMK
jgi:hypothetical protein